MTLEFKDYIAISASAVAISLSLITLLINLRQKTKDNLRAFRKELTEVIKEIVETNVSIAKIELEGKELTNKNYDIRRIYNTRRRYLIARAEFLIKDIPQYVNQVDLSIIAQACMANGLYEKANEYFLKAIEISSLNIELIFNLRGYARFLYLDNNLQKGTQFFEDALVKLESNNLNFSEAVRVRELCDTYIFYSRAEYGIANFEKAKELFLKAEAVRNAAPTPFLKHELAILLRENSYLNGTIKTE